MKRCERGRASGQDAFCLLPSAACKQEQRAEAAERHGLSYTHFTNTAELFVEFDALAKGAESAFAAHVTRLSDFKPLASGTVTAILSEGGAPEERFSANAPSVPGIFRPVAKPQHAGQRRLVFEIAFDGAVSRHDLGLMTVFESEQAAIAAAPKEEEEGGGIVYLKEQQWKTEFATAPVTEGEVRGSVPVNGVLRPRPDGEARVGAPAGGRFLTTSRSRGAASASTCTRSRLSRHPGAVSRSSRERCSAA